MDRCAGCGYGPMQADFRFCPACARPAPTRAAAPTWSPSAVASIPEPWTWRQKTLLWSAVALGITILVALAYLILFVWLGLTLVEAILYPLIGWIGLRALGLRLTPPAPALPIRRRPVRGDDAHDAAISIAAVLGARDALHRR